MLGLRRLMGRQVRIPRPDPRLALLVVVLWSLSLCCIDAAAKLRVRRSFRLVASPDACVRMRAPSPKEVLRWVLPGEVLWVRKVPGRGSLDSCYELEDAAGMRGWAPYNPAYLSSDGVSVRWRRW